MTSQPIPNQQNLRLSFDDTAIAFKSRSTGELKKAEWLFSLFKYKWIINYGPGLASWALSMRLPVKGLIRKTIFDHFCGGENIEDCSHTISQLAKFGVGTILDYSVEGEDTEKAFDETEKELLRTIREAARKPKEIPFAVFKVTGIGRFGLLEKIDSGEKLSAEESKEWERLQARFNKLCDTAAEEKVRLLVDAEESWIQQPIDDLTMAAMQRHNKTEVLIYNTLQMYRHDRISFLKDNIRTAKAGGFKLGYKVVRGAYMEKERARAEEKGYPSPIQPDKASSDKDYDKAIDICFENRDFISVCAGSHNENSSMLLAKMITEAGLSPSDDRFWFAQLLGMSDHISYNLAASGFNVAKYVPYGPVKAVMPYLGRRAKENSSLSGQTGRELSLLKKELARRAREKKDR